MDLRLRPDEQAVDDTFSGFFARECPSELVRAAAGLGFDRGLWDRLCETGAPGMAVPESAAGGGASLGELALVVRHLGRHLAPVPLIEHAVATRLLHATPEADASLVEALAGGDQIATVSFRRAQSGVAPLVPAGAVADVVVAFDSRGILAEVSEPPMAAAANTADLPLADRRLDRARPVAPSGGDPMWSRAVAEWHALMAVALVGIGSRALEIGTHYVRERHQFGVPIGSFQAIQHGLAGVATRLDGAALLADRAIHALDHRTPAAETLPAMAFLFAGGAAHQAAAASLQYHGGYGYAEEYDIQLYYRRATGWALQFGDPGPVYRRLAGALLPARHDGES